MSDVTYPCYWQKQDKSGDWYWIYYAKNAEEIARCTESYESRADCLHSIKLMQASSSDKIFYTENKKG